MTVCNDDGGANHVTATLSRDTSSIRSKSLQMPQSGPQQSRTAYYTLSPRRSSDTSTPVRSPAKPSPKSGSSAPAWPWPLSCSVIPRGRSQATVSGPASNSGDSMQVVGRRRDSKEFSPNSLEASYAGLEDLVAGTSSSSSSKVPMLPASPVAPAEAAVALIGTANRIMEGEHEGQDSPTPPVSPPTPPLPLLIPEMSEGWPQTLQDATSCVPASVARPTSSAILVHSHASLELRCLAMEDENNGLRATVARLERCLQQTGSPQHGHLSKLPAEIPQLPGEFSPQLEVKAGLDPCASPSTSLAASALPSSPGQHRVAISGPSGLPARTSEPELLSPWSPNSMARMRRREAGLQGDMSFGFATDSNDFQSSKAAVNCDYSVRPKAVEIPWLVPENVNSLSSGGIKEDRQTGYSQILTRCFSPRPCSKDFSPRPSLTSPRPSSRPPAARASSIQPPVAGSTSEACLGEYSHMATSCSPRPYSCRAQPNCYSVAARSGYQAAVNSCSASTASGPAGTVGTHSLDPTEMGSPMPSSRQPATCSALANGSSSYASDGLTWSDMMHRSPRPHRRPFAGDLGQKRQLSGMQDMNVFAPISPEHHMHLAAASAVGSPRPAFGSGTANSTVATRISLGSSQAPEGFDARSKLSSPFQKRTAGASRYSMLRICENLPRNVYDAAAARSRSTLI